MADPRLLNQAAGSYAQARWIHDAARCYRAAGAYRRAADAWRQVGAVAEAATDFAAAGMAAEAAWIFVHELGDVAAARAVLRDVPPRDDSASQPARVMAKDDLERRLASARCDVAEQRSCDDAIAVLEEVMGFLQRPDYSWGLTDVEGRAVDLADVMLRPDLAALVFAAAVRGGHASAAERWDAWSRRALGVPLQLPDPDTDVAWRGVEQR
jgi:hypothetical protein